MHPHPYTQDATHPSLYRSDDLHDALCHCRSTLSFLHGSNSSTSTLSQPHLKTINDDI
ncbi:hypothetical protein M422DRAFT_31432 [Sphaerobolus stellatus SS14]|uniref:Uncharacterized protein n=1 Tax=Sphaerobolus stellatus (strain SS14) TaxID=990650 RepID=A0A0C9VKT1_SPHS4|nr:hypothetical protein M422DRAFT_31432 [Sphaerobolus stellatus SS14]